MLPSPILALYTVKRYSLNAHYSKFSMNMEYLNGHLLHIGADYEQDKY